MNIAPRKGFLVAMLVLLAVGVSAAGFMRIDTWTDLYQYGSMFVHGPDAFRALSFRRIHEGDSFAATLRQYPATHVSTAGVFRVACLHRRPHDVTFIAKADRLIYASGSHFEWEKIFVDGLTGVDRQEYDAAVSQTHPSRIIIETEANHTPDGILR